MRDCLKEGKTKLEKLDGQTNEAFAFMRKAANTLLLDIMLDCKGRMSREFESVHWNEDVALIKQNFTRCENESDNDINISLYQVSILVNVIANDFDYPNVNIYGYVGYQSTLDFLEKLCDSFDWETYESRILGKLNMAKI